MRFGAVGALEAAVGASDIGVADRVVDVLAGEPPAASAHRVEPHAHRRLFGAVDGDLRDAIDLRQALRQDACRRRRRSAPADSVSDDSASGSTGASAGLNLR